MAAKKKAPAASPPAFPQKFRIKLEGMEGSEVAGFCVPFDVQTVFGTRARVAVRGTINGFSYRSSIMNMGEGHMMVVNREMRDGAAVKAGDIVEVVMERDTEERTIEAPPDFTKALNASPKAKALFDKLSYTHRKEYVRWITGAKRPETRVTRIERSIKMLNAGTKTPD